MYWSNSLKYFAQGTMLKCFLKYISLYCILISIYWSHNIMLCLFFFLHQSYIFHKCCANLWCICGKAKIIHLGFFFRHYCLRCNAMLQRGITQFFKKKFATRTFSIFRTNRKNNICNGNPACCIILVQEIFGTRIEDFFCFYLN